MSRSCEDISKFAWLRLDPIPCKQRIALFRHSNGEICKKKRTEGGAESKWRCISWLGKRGMGAH